MAATARMILHVDPGEKARWVAEARKAGISTSEFVRRAAAGHDPDLVITPEEAEMLKQVTAEVNAATARMASNLDAISATIAGIRADFHDEARHEEIRAAARAEYVALGSDFDLFKRLRELAE